MSNKIQKVSVPDTLDLVERGKLGINGLMGSVDPDIYYEPYFLTFYGVKPAYMLHWSSMLSGVMPKYLEAMALLKCMTGSGKLIHEDGIINSLLDNAKEDGLVYDFTDPKRPWNVGMGYGVKSWDEDYASLAGNGRFVNGMYYYYQLTGDDEWKARMKRTCEKMLELAVFVDDYAYYPNVGCGNDFSYPKKTGWKHTNEPTGPHEGSEGATTFHQAQPIRGLIKWYKLSGDERMLDLAARLTRFVMKPKFYGGLVDADPVYDSKRAHFWGHFHGNLAAFRGIMDYACVTGDYNAMEFVRDGYEWARQNMCPQLGLDAKFEGCATADYTALGIQLSDAGIGDYWNDVDSVVRNALSECQVTDLDLIRKINEGCTEREKNSPWGAPFDKRFYRGMGTKIMPNQECTDNVLERSIGAFAWELRRGCVAIPMLMHCCTSNGVQGFYYAWEAVVRHHSGTSNINLLFNRTSPWLDIESHIPYEGKVVVKNKCSKNIHLRIPGWVKLSDVKITVNGNIIKPEFAGRYALLNELSGNETICFEFPIFERTMEVLIPSLNERRYRGAPKLTVKFKGTTCIEKARQPEGEHLSGQEKKWIALFNRPKYSSNKTLYKESEYYVAENPIKWY